MRYLPASQVAQVGGDWYDAFETADGTLSLVIGDVAGHDEDAAAAMAQVRNVMRGVAQTLQEPPAAVLAGLDRALSGLQLSLLATVVVAQLECEGAARTFTWCNAGHPPPVLVRADGTVRLLDAEPDLLVGLTTAMGRRDHVVQLAVGDTVLLYTDGLVETRGGDIEQTSRSWWRWSPGSAGTLDRRRSSTGWSRVWLSLTTTWLCWPYGPTDQRLGRLSRRVPKCPAEDTQRSFLPALQDISASPAGCARPATS